MTPEKQRIAILTYMGWSNFSRLGRRGENGPETALRGTSPEGIKGQLCPNPLTNLNYIHEVEKHIPEDFWGDYHSMLEWSMGIERNSLAYRTRMIVRATAALRTEAILRTLDKWEI